ncbi:hypothetical protein ABTX81_05315 [Kitasatospora sp. NPDC097605]|uniref:hypothetical protein n=1 Tax=Kitasatospora sp. NPDC097605 TaxID=3157226 RepID=UPI0033309409
MLRQAVTNAAVPVRAVITGSPVLAARLWAPAATRLGQAAEERAAIAKALAETRATELAKLTDEKAIARARAGHAQADKTARAAKRGRAADAAGGAVLAAVVAGPVSWSLVGPWVPVATWSGIGLWCIGAMMHAPKPPGEQGQQADTAHGFDTGHDDEQADAGGGQERAEPTVSPTLAPAELAATVEHMVALRAQSDGGAGKVLLSEVLASLQRHGRYPGASTRDFGAAVRAAGLPVEKRVRVGEAISPGLTAAGLTTHFGHPPRLPAHAVPDHTPTAAA